jgi:cell division protein FtsB
MSTHESQFDEFLAGVEKQARKARMVSIAITVLTVVMAGVFLYLTFRQITKARAELRSTIQQNEIKKKENESLAAENEKLKIKNEGLKGTITAIDKGSKSSSDAQTPESELAPRIYLTVPYEDQVAPARKISASLQAKNKDYIVPGVELVDVPLSWHKTEVRYFREDDRNIANEIARLLRELGVKDAESRFVGKYKNVSPRQYEVWFSKDALTQN